MTLMYNRLEQKERRRTLRKNLPPAELILWSKLKGKQMHGVKFRRQYGIGPYIVDFYCREHRLAIELDGESHYFAGAQEYDRVRDQFLQSMRITVLRFTNTKIHENLAGVLMVISQYLTRPPLAPPYKGGEIVRLLRRSPKAGSSQ